MDKAGFAEQQAGPGTALRIDGTGGDDRQGLEKGPVFFGHERADEAASDEVDLLGPSGPGLQVPLSGMERRDLRYPVVFIRHLMAPFWGQATRPARV